MRREESPTLRRGAGTSRCITHGFLARQLQYYAVPDANQNHTMNGSSTLPADSKRRRVGAVKSHQDLCTTLRQRSAMLGHASSGGNLLCQGISPDAA